MIYLIFILCWATIVLFVIGITMRGERAIIQNRLEALRLSMAEDIDKVAPELSKPFAERIIRPMLANMANLLTRLMPVNTSVIAQKLDQSGNKYKLKPADFVGMKMLCILICLAASFAFVFMSDKAEPINRLLAVLFSLVIGYAIPDSVLESSIRERQREIRKSLSNAIDLLVVSTEAGLGFDGALQKVSDKMTGALADEFRRALTDMNLGRSRAEALRSMANRVGIPELTTFVAAVHQAELLGTSIAHVLRVQADTIRTQRNLRAREATAKLPVKLLFPLIFFIFPAIFIVVLGPGAVGIYKALVQMNH